MDEKPQDIMPFIIKAQNNILARKIFRGLSLSFSLSLQ